MLESALKINIITHFPQIYNSYFNCSFFGKLVLSGQIEVSVYSLFEYAKAKNIKKIDDKICGGGSGLLLKFDFLYEFINFNLLSKGNFIHPSPSGILLSNKVIQAMTSDSYTFLCTRYEGVDARAIKYFSMKEISIGDYILYDGDTAALVLINSLIRNRFVKKSALISESLSNGLLEYDQYTKPNSFLGLSVPDVLLSGHNLNIENWKYQNSMLKTKTNRLDLYNKYNSNKS